MRIPDATAMLARTPKTLTTLLTGLPEEWLHRNDGPGTWSAYDIVGHLLIADATNWLPRIRMVLWSTAPTGSSRRSTGRPC